jgi:polysaccharide export outer membrane protein
MVDSFQGTFGQQIRIVGATEKPASLPYRANMTLLDAMIEVGGLSQYAAGDKARLVRHDKASGKQTNTTSRSPASSRRGDTSANVRLEPGDVIIIPESMF